MKTFPVLAGGLVAVLVLVALFLRLPSSSDEAGVDTRPARQTAVEDSLRGSVGATDMPVQENREEQRRRAMHNAFARLEESRRHLKSQAGLLKSRTWGLELPAVQATQANQALGRVFVYLRNPAMLGAYFDVNEIENEIKKVQAMSADLTGLEKIIAGTPPDPR